MSAVVEAADKKTLDRQSSACLQVSEETQVLTTSPTPAKTLTTFFSEKLADVPSLLSCVTSLTALTESPAFGVGEGMEVTRA